jgi:hypothetical protein
VTEPTNTQPANTEANPDAANAEQDEDQGETNRVDEVWTYAGRRMLHGKRYHAWQDGSRRERYYAKSAATVIGGRYVVTVSREGTNTWLHGDPRYTGEQVDERTRREMEALDIAAMADLAAKARERNDARRKALDAALQPLVDLAAKVSFGHERDAFLAYVIRRITHPW